MYHENRMIFRCPVCGSVQPFDVHDIVSAQEQPEIRRAILDGSLFESVCKSCGTITPVIYPLFYSDRKLDFMIHLIDGDEEDPAFDDLQDSSTIFRVVRDENALREKIMIFESGMDDRAVEIAKMVRADQLQSANPNLLIGAMYYTKERGKDRFLVFDEENPIATVSFDTQLYDVCRNQLLQRLPDELLDDYEIDPDWAQAVLRFTGLLSE